jgi:amino acid transporter
MIEKKLSLPAAILININIMLGAGVFINTVELAKRAGFLGSFMYPFIALLIIPLIIVITKLLKVHPSGGFYKFAQAEISPFAGFMSAWIYFIAKLASAMLMIHVAMSLIRQIFPSLQNISSIYIFDIAILSLFIFFNTFNLRTGSQIQMGFLTFKLMPVLFVIGAGILFFSPATAATFQLPWHSLPSAIPFVLYAAMGFEAICAMSNKIEDSEKNAPKSIFYSVLVVISLLFLFQFLFYFTLGDTLAQLPNYLGAFPALLSYLLPANPAMAIKLISFFHFAIAISALGGCYGILYSNNWNLYILAQHKHVFFSSIFTRLNKHAIPIFCLLAEWIICGLFLALTAGNQIPLQQTAALGTTIAYTFCVIAFLLRSKRNDLQKDFIVSIAGLVSCSLLIGACIRNFLYSGIMPLLSFLLLFVFGIIMYGITKKD